MPCRKVKPYLILVIATAVVGAFLFGYDCGVVSGAMVVIRQEFTDVDDRWQSILVSSTVASAALFSLVGMVLNDRLGRKPTILIASTLFVVGAVIIAASPTKECILIGRIVTGTAVGLSSMTVPSYIAETAPTEVRGTLLAFFQIMITGGFFVSNVTCAAFSYIKRDSWRYMFGVAGVPAALQFVVFLFMPESPRWLVQHGKDNQALEILSRLTGDNKRAKETISQYQETGTEKATVGRSLLGLLTNATARRALVIGAGLQLFQQLCGINTVMYYSTTLVKMAGVPGTTAAIWLSSAISGVHLLATLPSSHLVERHGRRPLLLWSMFGVAVSAGVVAAGFELIRYDSPVLLHQDSINPSCGEDLRTCNDCSYRQHCGYCFTSANHSHYGACYPLNRTTQSAWFGPCSDSYSNATATMDIGFCPSRFSAVPLVGLVLYLCSFSCGYGPVVWTINGEIYPQYARTSGNAVATFTNWAFNLLVTYTFLPLSNAITRQGLFGLYGCITLVAFCIYLLILPETRGIPLERLETKLTGPIVVCGSPTSTST